MADSLYTWRGFEDGNYPFLHLSPHFRESYKASISRNSGQTFLRLIEANGKVREQTFAGFNQDVIDCLEYRKWIEDGPEILITLSGNTYSNLVHIVAALLSGKILCPMSGSEEEAKSRAKLARLDQSHQIYSDTAAFAEPMNVPRLMKSAVNFPERSSSEPIIYIFTSGSTGEPKIVQQREIGLMCNIDSLIEIHQLGPGRHIATSLPVFHVNALEFSFLGTLLSGAQLTLFERFELGTFLHGIERFKPDILSTIPPILRVMLDQQEKVRAASQSLNYVVTAASYLSPSIAQKFCDTFSFGLIQGYGLSEAINFSAVLPPSLSEERRRYWLTNFPTPSIGCAVRGNEILVLGENGAPLEEEKVGELAIRGINVMTGYRGGDGCEFKDNYLLTGDLGCFRTCQETGESFYFITGRRKEIIKRMGETISLKEIDDAILPLIPTTATVIAIGFIHTGSGEEIGAVAHGASAEAVASALSSLPDSIRPRVVLSVAARPLTESGKPKRWEYQKLFERYQSTIFGKITVSG